MGEEVGNDALAFRPKEITIRLITSCDRKRAKFLQLYVVSKSCRHTLPVMLIERLNNSRRWW